MDIADWRERIDIIDRELMELLNQRAHAALEIGRLKRVAGLPIYEPQRESVIFENVSRLNVGPLPTSELQRIFERIIDVMRSVQRFEIESERNQAIATSVHEDTTTRREEK